MMLTLEEVAESRGQGDLSFLHPLEIGTGDLEKVEADSPRVGKEVQVGPAFRLSESQRVGCFCKKLVAILEKREELYKPHKGFSDEKVCYNKFANICYVTSEKK